MHAKHSHVVHAFVDNLVVGCVVRREKPGSNQYPVSTAKPLNLVVALKWHQLRHERMVDWKRPECAADVVGVYLRPNVLSVVDNAPLVANAPISSNVKDADSNAAAQSHASLYVTTAPVEVLPSITTEPGYTKKSPLVSPWLILQFT